jgi:hypothetical protein
LRHFCHSFPVHYYLKFVYYCCFHWPNNSGQEAGVNIVSNSGQGVSSVPLTSQKTSIVLDSDQGGANTVSNRESVLS